MKYVVKIFNLIYLVLAAVAITCFCTKPYIEINGGYKVQGEQIAEFIPAEVETYLTKEEIKQIIDDKEVKVTLDIKVPAKMVFNFKDKEATRNTINEMIDETVNGTMDELKPIIHELAEAIAKKVANSMIYQAIEKYVDEYKIDDPKLNDTGKALVDAGIDGVYIENFTNEVYDKLTSENATIDGVMEVVDNKLVDVVTKLEANGVLPETDVLEVLNESSDEIRGALIESFQAFGICDEDGNITDIDAAVENLLAGLIDTLLEHDDEQKAPEDEGSRVFRGASEEEVEETESELTEKVRQLIDQYVSKVDIPSYVTEYGLYIFAATLFLMFPWAVLALVSLIRILRPKKCWVRTWYVFVFAFIQLILGVAITIATSKFLPQIADLLPLGDDLRSMLSTLTLTIKTSSFIPSIIYLAMIPFGIVYIIFAHKVKRDYKDFKREKREQKRAAKRAA